MAKIKIIFASNNKGKIAELQALLRHHQIEIVPQALLNISEIDETAPTFVENALLKARHASRSSGLPAIADDSGLEVFSLQGRPGVHSARFAGDHANANDNIAKLLHELGQTPPENRGAQFYCSLVFITRPDDPTPLVCQGTWEGSILQAPQGKNGFGYDPIFYVPSEKCSAAELTQDKKNFLSHRGQALRSLIDLLPTKILI